MLFTFVVCISLSTTQFAYSSDDPFINGLNDRRLFSLVEAHCRQRLADPELEPAPRVDLTIALCRTYAQHALNTPRAQRDALWQATEQTVDAFRRTHSDNPHAMLVEMQAALTVLARGELARQEAEVEAPGAPSLAEARQALQTAINQLKAVDGQVEVQLRKVGRDASDAAMSEQELISLQRNVRYQQARALRNQALCYAAGSPERSDSLLRALDLLSPLAQLRESDALVWNSRIDEVVCLRLRKQFAQAAQRIAALEAARPSPTNQLLARAERVRISLAADQPQNALAVLRQGREIAGRTSADLDLAHVETFIALWQAAQDAKQTEQAADWQQRATDMVQAMEQLYGPYWTRRGEMLLAASVGSAAGGENLDLLVRVAKNHYLRKEFAEAVGAYEQAATVAISAGDSQRAFDLFHAAALIERRTGRRDAGIRRQRELTKLLRDHPKAPLVHLQATLDAAQVARDGTSDSLDQYIELLQEQIALWPQDASTDKARGWLARLQEHRGDWASALETWRGVTPADEQLHSAAIDGVARCYTHLLEQLRAAGQPTEAPADRAARWLENIFVEDGMRLPQTFSATDRRAALHAARLRLQFTTGGFTTAQALLEAALRDATDDDTAWKSQAHSLLVVAQAGAGNRDAARQTLTQLSGGSAQRQLEMLDGLRDVAEESQPAVRRELAFLQLEVVERLKADAARLQPAQRQALELAEAHALASAGRRKESLFAFQRLAEKHPDDPQVQRAYAEILIAADDRKNLLLARDAWRNILRRTRPETPDWFTAKYNIALAHWKLGETEQAAQMIKLLQTVHPEMGGPAMQAKFLELLSRSRQPAWQ